jgi:hypothetical protein
MVYLSILTEVQLACLKGRWFMGLHQWRMTGNAHPSHIQTLGIKNSPEWWSLDIHSH